MAVTYIVQQGSSASGPWTAVTGSPFSSANCTISGETPNTSYYVQITAQDLVLGISSTPAVFGPYTTLPTSSESPAGTTVTTVGPSINASPTPGSAGQGNIITIVATGNGQVAVNGQTIGATANVTELYYTGALPGANGATAHTAYQFNGTIWNGPIIVGNGGTSVPNPIPAGPAIAISTIANQAVNATFTVSGVLTGYSSPPTLQYSDNAGAFGALPVSNTVTATTFSFTHPAIATANASFTVSLRDQNNTAITATSNAFVVQTVVAGAPGVPTAVTSPSQASTSVNVGFSPPTTGGSLDNGVYQVLEKKVTDPTYTNGPVVSYITPGHGSFTDSTGVVWTLNAAGNIFRNAVQDTSAFSVTQVLLISGTPQVAWQVNSSGQWWQQNIPASIGNWTGGGTTSPLVSPGVTVSGLPGPAPQSFNLEVYATNSSGQGLSSAPISAATTTGSGSFTTTATSQTNFLAPNGSQFVPKGVHSWNPAALVNVDLAGLATGGGPLFTCFPRTKIIRAHSFFSDGLWTATQFTPVVNYLTARGVVLIIENGDYDAAYSQSDLNTATAWYGTLATAFANNPYVWFESPNEPSGSFTFAQTQYTQTYAAVRNNGYIGPFGCCSNYSNYPSATTLSGMHNVWVDCHMYCGDADGDVNTFISQMNSRAAPMRGTDADGITVPVCSFEFGDGENGVSQDPNYAACLTNVINGTITVAGWAAFCMNGNLGFTTDILNEGNTPVSFGTTIIPFM